VLLLTAVYAGYAAARTLVDQAPGQAIRNGWAVLHVERLLGMDVERVAIDWLIQWTWLSVLASYAYAALHYVITLAVLAWLYMRRPAQYRLARSVLVGTTCLALVCFWAVPTAPPRLLSAEYVDVLAATAPWGWWGAAASAPRGMASLTNQYAALPSMHVGWALWAGAAVALLARRRLVRLVAAGYPLLIGVVVVVTGNHYVLDALAGAAAVCVMAFLCLRLDDRALTRRVLRSRPRWSRLGHSVHVEEPADEPARLHPPRRGRVRRNVEKRLHSRDGAPHVPALCGLCTCRAGTSIDRLWTPAHASIPEDR
jgi:membrane-associated phospholipid phosphatase